MERPKIQVAAVVLGAPNARELADFYHHLLGWAMSTGQEDWVMMRSPDGGAGLSFQTETNYRPPVWPAGTDDQQMMVHLDIAVADLHEGVEWALLAGATVADYQPQGDVRVMLDPAGHPFCLFPVSFEED